MVNIKRKLSQLFFLVLLGEFSFYGIFRCPFAVPYTECGSCPVVQCPGKKLWLGFWLLLPLSLLLFGRGFCSWACPGGLFSELLSKASLLKNTVKGLPDTLLTSLRYIVLAACLFTVFFIENPRWAIPIRTGDFFYSVQLTFEHADSLWLVRTLFILAGFAAILIVPHFWCRYLCPTGGLLEAFKNISFLTYRKTERCSPCDACRKACPAETRPAETNCTNCGDCKNTCPIDDIHLKKGY